MPESLSLRQQLDRHFPQFESALREQIERHGQLRRFAPGHVLMRPGQYFSSSILVLEGKVKIYREGDDGNEFFLYYLEPGEACALSMICAMRSEASELLAKVMEETEAILVPIELMDELMRNHRSWYYFVLETYRNRFEELLAVIDSVAFRNLDERLSFYLSRQAKAFGTRELPLTHQQIADDLNTSREVVSRLLKKMEHEGLVSLGRHDLHWKG